MAEFAAAAMLSLAELGGTAAAGISTGITAASGAGIVGVAPFAEAAAAGGGLFSGSTVASILSGGATALSVMATMRAGESRARSLELAAADAETETRVEDLNTANRKTSLKKALAAAIGERDVAAAASGVDLTFGTPAIARGEAVTDAERALSIEDSGAAFRKARLRERAASFRALATESRAGALGRAAAFALEGGARIARRG